MYGYIYETYNALNSTYYIGQKRSEIFVPTYYGSGKYIKRDIKKYGKKNFKVRLLQEANTQDELDKLEKKYIKKYKKKYGSSCLNQATGGLTSVNAFEYADSSTKKEFSKKMTKINKKRCGSKEFKDQTSKRMHEKYKNKRERELQSERVKKAWADKTLRKEQSKRLKEHYKNHPKDCSFNYKQCILILPDSSKHIFDSVKALKKFIKTEYDITFANPKLHQMLENGETYHPFHKNTEKFKNFDGAKFSFVKSD